MSDRAIRGRLHVLVHPTPPPKSAVVVGPMSRETKPQRLRRGAHGSWSGRLTPGWYMVHFTGPALVPEFRPVRITGAGCRIVIFAVPQGVKQRSIRVGDRRMPTPIPREAIDVFLPTNADDRIALEVLELARREGLSIQRDRIVDESLRNLVQRIDEVAERPNGDRRQQDQPDQGAPGAIQEANRAMPRRRLSDRPSAVIPFEAPDEAVARRAVAALRRSPHVAAAGARLSADRKHPAVRRPAIRLRVRSAVDPIHLVGDVAQRLQLEKRWGALPRVSRPLPQFGKPSPLLDEFVVHLPVVVDDDADLLIDELLATGEVIFAVPEIAFRAVLHGEPDDMSTLQWEHELMKVASAHQHLVSRGKSRGEVVLAVLDLGVPHVGGHVLHADLEYRVKPYDGHGRRITSHDAPPGVHGAHVALVAAATDHPGAGPGTVGVAPDARVAVFTCETEIQEVSDSLLIAAGLAGVSDAPPADVIVMALQATAPVDWPPVPPATLPPFVNEPAVTAVTAVAHRGRGGRGCPIILSAGNYEGQIDAKNRLATTADALTCGASAWSTNAEGKSTEGKASLSADGPGLDCLAPGYRGAVAQTHGVGSVTNTAWPSHALAEGHVRKVTSVGSVGRDCYDIEIELSQPIGIEQIPSGGRLLFKTPQRQLWLIEEASRTTSSDPLRIQLRAFGIMTLDNSPIGAPQQDAWVGICDLRLATLSSRLGQDKFSLSEPIPSMVRWCHLVDRDHPEIPTEVRIQYTEQSVRESYVTFMPGDISSSLDGGSYDLWMSASSYRPDFGQTSSAAALCAGLAALMLAANPDLTSAEVRHLICETATPLLGLDSDEQGYGRIAADEAVLAALDYQHPRDLYLYTANKEDTGRAVDSDDIWAASQPYTDEDLAAYASAPFATPATEPLSAQPHICVRVRNRGTEASLPAWLRLYIAPTRRAAPFIWPKDFIPSSTGNATHLDPGTYLIAEVYLEPGIPGGGAHVEQVQMPSWAVPGHKWDRDVLVEITPHDGPIHGNTIATNDNLARRSLQFV